MSEPHEHDEQLRSRLRAGDPASSLPPADPSAVARLLEDTMSHDAQRPADLDDLAESRAAGARDRGPLTWLVAAAAAVVIVGAGIFTLVGRDADSTEQLATAEDRIQPSSPPVSVTTLAAGAPAGGRCMVPTAEVLARQEIAFEGAVQEVEEGTVVLAPSTFYAGQETDLVELQAPAPQLELLLDAVPFEEGRSYLVAGSGGRVTLCGFTGPRTERLAGLYEDAFGG